PSVSSRSVDDRLKRPLREELEASLVALYKLGEMLMEPHISRRLPVGEVPAYDSIASILRRRQDGGSVVSLASVLDVIVGMILVDVEQATNAIVIGPQRGND